MTSVDPGTYFERIVLHSHGVREANYRAIISYPLGVNSRLLFVLRTPVCSCAPRTHVNEANASIPRLKA